MQISPAIALHLGTALGALLLGPWVIWARAGRTRRPALHRALGLCWVLLMVTTAASALFIRNFRGLHFNGYSPIHLLVPVTAVTLALAFRHLHRGNIRGHRNAMLGLYLGACVTAGLFTLLPSRLLGAWVWNALG